jgi:putative acetyltransferase
MNEPVVVPVRTGEELARIRELFWEYGESLRFHICFESFERELAELPGPYAPPDGELWLAIVGHTSAGCVGLKAIEPGVAEIKRLYVRPNFRGMKLGRKLAQTAIEKCRLLGYRKVRLDTLPVMKEAQSLYRSLGFQPIGGGTGPDDPIDMELNLTESISAL